MWLWFFFSYLYNCLNWYAYSEWFDINNIATSGLYKKCVPVLILIDLSTFTFSFIESLIFECRLNLVLKIYWQIELVKSLPLFYPWFLSKYQIYPHKLFFLRKFSPIYIIKIKDKYNINICPQITISKLQI